MFLKRIFIVFSIIFPVFHSEHYLSNTHRVGEMKPGLDILNAFCCIIAILRRRRSRARAHTPCPPSILSSSAFLRSSSVTFPPSSSHQRLSHCVSNPVAARRLTGMTLHPRGDQWRPAVADTDMHSGDHSPCPMSELGAAACMHGRTQTCKHMDANTKHFIFISGNMNRSKSTGGMFRRIYWSHLYSEACKTIRPQIDWNIRHEKISPRPLQVHPSCI